MRVSIILIGSILLMALSLGTAPAAYAAIVNFEMSLDVAQATTAQPLASGSGSGTAMLDTDTNLFSWDISYVGLYGIENNAHFHLGAPGVPGGIQLGLPPGSPKIGSATVSAGDETDILANLWYVNIHSTNSPGGEIRGQVVQVAAVPLLPVSALGLLAALLLGSALWLIRRRRFANTKARL